MATTASRSAGTTSTMQAMPLSVQNHVARTPARNRRVSHSFLASTARGGRPLLVGWYAQVFLLLFASVSVVVGTRPTTATASPSARDRLVEAGLEGLPVHAWDNKRKHLDAASERPLGALPRRLDSPGDTPTEPALDVSGAADEGGLGEEAREGGYLNGLVAQSVENSANQECNIAFAKTHKVGSTTMAILLLRYARRHGKKIAAFGGLRSAISLDTAARRVKADGQRLAIMHYHFTDFTRAGMSSMTWEGVTKRYEQIMREDETINYVTMLRDHRGHFLSYYYFYVQPVVQLSVEEFFQSDRGDLNSWRTRLMNPMSAEFRIVDQESLNDFIAQLPQFCGVILTDRFDEGLVLLRRSLDWDMIDITYCRMMETKAGSRRWDGKPLENVPNFEDLSESTQEIIDSYTSLDEKLYAAASKLHQERMEAAGDEVTAELEEFGELQDTMNDYLDRNSSSEASQWYRKAISPYLDGPVYHF